MLEHLTPVLLWSGQRLLVTVYDARLVIFYCSQPDETLANESLARIGDFELLEIGIKRGHALLLQKPLSDPVLEVLLRACINILGIVIGWKALAENHSHEVMRTLCKIGGLHGRRN